MPIDGYVVDFACVAKHLVIELDGGQHSADIAYDQQRTKALNAHGFRVIRFWNSEITQNLSGVLDSIATALAAPSPFPLPLKGERAKKAH
jgi:very-short-patch-repair endonuclease